jgi:hypothetical protein
MSGVLAAFANRLGLAQKLLGFLSAKCPVFTSNVRLDFCRKLNDETWIELIRIY